MSAWLGPSAHGHPALWAQEVYTGALSPAPWGARKGQGQSTPFSSLAMPGVWLATLSGPRSPGFSMDPQGLGNSPCLSGFPHL